MKRSRLILLLPFFCACTKTKTESLTAPEMIYTNLEDVEAGLYHSIIIDADKDGRGDIIFYGTPIADPVFRLEKIQLSAGSDRHSQLYMNENNGTPLYRKGDFINRTPLPNHNWWEVNEAQLAQKVTTESGGTYWNGDWKEAFHHYLAFRSAAADGLHAGWIELSIDQYNDRIILHRCAISKKPGLAVKAGY